MNVVRFGGRNRVLALFRRRYGGYTVAVQRNTVAYDHCTMAVRWCPVCMRIHVFILYNRMYTGMAVCMCSVLLYLYLYESTYLCAYMYSMYVRRYMCMYVWLVVLCIYIYTYISMHVSM